MIIYPSPRKHHHQGHLGRICLKPMSAIWKDHHESIGAFQLVMGVPLVIIHWFIRLSLKSTIHGEIAPFLWKPPTDSLDSPGVLFGPIQPGLCGDLCLWQQILILEQHDPLLRGLQDQPAQKPPRSEDFARRRGM